MAELKAVGHRRQRLAHQAHPGCDVARPASGLGRLDEKRRAIDAGVGAVRQLQCIAEVVPGVAVGVHGKGLATGGAGGGKGALAFARHLPVHRDGGQGGGVSRVGSLQGGGHGGVETSDFEGQQLGRQRITGQAVPKYEP